MESSVYLPMAELRFGARPEPFPCAQVSKPEYLKVTGVQGFWCASHNMEDPWLPLDELRLQICRLCSRFHAGVPGFQMWRKWQKSPQNLAEGRSRWLDGGDTGDTRDSSAQTRTAFEAPSCMAGVLRILHEQVPVPVYHPTPSQTRLATQLTEEEQIRIAQRIGLIQHLPKGVYDPGRDGSEKKIRECVICMMDFVYGDPIRFLPCMHIYHLDCIDDWLMRSFTCPSCMEPVDAALLSSYETN
ncbi:PREDICTED: RING finger protein 11 [Chlamydotis macqueenii]|uniref:RING finger protein 11 n=1 Tax=Chlamydotis macqueenii TaxID=187382 RepID=UPI000529EA44|nr:PREDICTED: RING finger protein 11 [Chlamydotis macqueenii]